MDKENENENEEDIYSKKDIYNKSISLLPLDDISQDRTFFWPDMPLPRQKIIKIDENNDKLKNKNDGKEKDSFSCKNKQTLLFIESLMNNIDIVDEPKKVKRKTRKRKVNTNE